MAFICVAGTALNACSADDSPSGKYAADFEGERMVINFIDDSKATFTLGESDGGFTVDCAYEAGESLIMLNCVGSSAIVDFHLKLTRWGCGQNLGLPVCSAIVTRLQGPTALRSPHEL